jgi:hypothetical protein
VQGSNILLAIDTTNLVIRTYGDTLSTVMPDASVSSGATWTAWSWELPTGATSVQVRYATRADYAGGTLTTRLAIATPLLGDGLALTAGTTYYWQARVASPVLGPWTDQASFVVPLTAPVAPGASMIPAMGATGVAINPTFTWAIVGGAVAYEFVIAEDIGQDDYFAIIDYSATTDVNMHVAREDLKYDTLYFWRVRAVGASISSSWTTQSFRTLSEPTTPEMIIVDEPPAPDPIIIEIPPAQEITLEIPPTAAPVEVIPDAILYVVIIVGAVLIIAVIVLIVRTRRVA